MDLEKARLLPGDAAAPAAGGKKASGLWTSFILMKQEAPGQAVPLALLLCTPTHLCRAPARAGAAAAKPSRGPADPSTASSRAQPPSLAPAPAAQSRRRLLELSQAPAPFHFLPDAFASPALAPCHPPVQSVSSIGGASGVDIPPAQARQTPSSQYPPLTTSLQHPAFMHSPHALCPL
eukprot:gene6159-6001_t